MFRHQDEEETKDDDELCHWVVDPLGVIHTSNLLQNSINALVNVCKYIESLDSNSDGHLSYGEWGEGVGS